MIDSNLIQSVIAGVAAGLTSLAVLPMLFKGQLLHKRELEAAKAGFAEVIAQYEARLEQKRERHLELAQLKDAEIERLQEAVQEGQRELRDQHAIIGDLTKQVLGSIAFLQSLAGLAQSERRGTGKPGA